MPSNSKKKAKRKAKWRSPEWMAELGQRGGKATLKKKGSAHFSKIAKRKRGMTYNRKPNERLADPQ